MNDFRHLSDDEIVFLSKARDDYPETVERYLDILTDMFEVLRMHSQRHGLPDGLFFFDDIKQYESELVENIDNFKLDVFRYTSIRSPAGSSADSKINYNCKMAIRLVRLSSVSGRGYVKDVEAFLDDIIDEFDKFKDI